MRNSIINSSQNLNNYFHIPNYNYSYSYNNIFNAPNLNISNNNLNNSMFQNNNQIIKNNSSFFYTNNNYYNTINNNINNNNIYKTNTINTNNNRIIINQIYSRNNNHSISNDLNSSYQNINLAQNTWMKNGNLFYSPTQLSNSKNMIYYNYNNLKYNNSYQNVTNRTYNSSQTLNFKDFYNINSNNSLSTNTKSNYSINNNNEGSKDINNNKNIQKQISQPNLNNITGKIEKIEIVKQNTINQEKEKEINIINKDPKDHFDPSEFKKIKRIGEGSYGKIYVVQWIKNNKKYAMKKIPIKTNDIVNKRKEKIKLMNNFIKKTKCPGIIKIYGNIVKKEKGEQDYHYYILMELAEKDWEKEISERKKINAYYEEKELFIIMHQLISTLALLQKNHITHRDIKPQNILISNGIFKLSDFGEARTLKRSGVIISRVRGTELFMSPILFHGLRHRLSQVGHNTFKSDVFSLGFCFLLAASLTFNSLYSIREVNDIKVIEELLDIYLSGRYSKKIIEIILDMLQVDENLRPDFITLEKKYFLKEK